jgi:outer membrane receptor protein involved in Fe transport
MRSIAGAFAAQETCVQTPGMSRDWPCALGLAGCVYVGWAVSSFTAAPSPTTPAASLSGRVTDPDTAPPGYVAATLKAGFERPFAGHSLTANLAVRNLLDQRYASFLSRYKAFPLAPGRAVGLRASCGF